MRSSSVRPWSVALCAGSILLLAAVGAAHAAPAAAASASTSASAAGAQPGTAAVAAPSAQAEGWLSWAATRRVLSRFAPALSLYYARSVTDPDAFEFSHQLGFLLACDFEATRSSR
jgi:hypothetical protein